MGSEDILYIAIQRQTAVTAYLKSKQLLLFAFERYSTIFPAG